MAKLGQCLTEQQVEAMISEADSDGDGQIDYTGTSQIMPYCPHQYMYNNCKGLTTNGIRWITDMYCRYPSIYMYTE